MESETLPTPERLKEDLQLIKEWISKQPHLPKVEDEEWLITILHHNKYSLEKTKRKLDNYFSFRTKYPEILKSRDPTSAEILQAMASDKIVLADKLTKNGELVCFAQLQPDTSIFEIKGVLKMLFMICDTVFLEHNQHPHTVLVTDCRHASYVHFLKSVPWIKIMNDVFFNAYSMRMKAFYLVNAPAHLDKVFNTMKELLPQKMAERFYVYPTIGNLCELLDENVVCSDFGGKGPSLADYENFTLKILKKYREWFLEQEDVCTNEELRSKTDNRVEDMQGSFRKLEVD